MGVDGSERGVARTDRDRFHGQMGAPSSLSKMQASSCWRWSLNYTRGRNIFRALFIVSVLGWIVYAVFFLPEDFWGPEPPIEPTMVKFGFCPVFLFLGAVLLPILSAVGWVTTTLLKNRQERERIDLEEHGEL
jgi:hypothetical protein